MNWLLPEYISDALPNKAARIDSIRRTVLEHFRLRGYELVMPPFLEYLDSLLTGSGTDLKLRTFKLVDQLSGRTLGVRADMTPQVARIDAHLLNRQGIARLCYCGSVLHTLPATLSSSREPIQLGAELYGYAGIEADTEIIRLMAASLTAVDVPASRIDISHVGVFRALVGAANLNKEQEEAILLLLQSKDSPGLQDYCTEVSEPYRSAFLRLPDFYGDFRVLDDAVKHLPNLPEIAAALTMMQKLNRSLPELPLSFDLADLRGYHYHNGIVFAAYYPNSPSAIALGGRYDGAGKNFGRFRPATGFSMDLREMASLVSEKIRPGAILSPYAGNDAVLAAKVNELRNQGQAVFELLPGETRCEGPHCDRVLVQGSANEGWIIQAINEVD